MNAQDLFSLFGRVILGVTLAFAVLVFANSTVVTAVNETTILFSHVGFNLVIKTILTAAIVVTAFLFAVINWWRSYKTTNSTSGNRAEEEHF